MAALLKGGSRRGYRLREGLSLHMGCDASGSRYTHKGTSFPFEKTAKSLLHTSFINLSCEATSNVHAIGNRVPVGFFFKPSGYKRPIIEIGVVATLLHKITLKDGLSFNGGPLVSSNTTKHGCHLMPFHTCEPASVTGSRLEMKVYGVTWFGARGRWTGWRSFSSLEDFSSVLDVSSSTESTESESENVEDFDFRNFPALTSSFFENYERPSEMEVRKKLGVWRNKAYVDKKLTLDSIPKPRGRTYDFGLGDVASKPPPVEAGARPQGGFDIDISFNECEVDALPQRQSPLGNLPSKIGEIDKWSEISKGSCIIEDRELQITEGTDFQVIEDAEFQSTEDKVLDHEQDFLWDPYNNVNEA